MKNRLLHLLVPIMLLPGPGLCSATDLSGNWMVSSGIDGLVRTYFNLKQEGTRITGSIRVTQFYFTISESTGDADGFKVTGTMQDGKIQRHVVYEGKLVGEELHIGTRRRFDGPLSELIAHRVPAGQGAYPVRVSPPALHKVADNGLAKTPPMGWNSWNKFAERVDDATVREIADAMVGSGMKDAGYVYINIDDTWEGDRDAQGNIQSNRKFPDMKALAAYVHSKGLKLGIYSSPGPNTCAGYEGSYGHEQQDARTYAAWGIDYLNTIGVPRVTSIPMKKCRLFISLWAKRCSPPDAPLSTAFASMVAPTCGNGDLT